MPRIQEVPNELEIETNTEALNNEVPVTFEVEVEPCEIINKK
jgi:hypothetical protein